MPTYFLKFFQKTAGKSDGKCVKILLCRSPLGWLVIFNKKDRVLLCWPGCDAPPIHRCYPTTAQRGDFCLLRFRPGPMRPSLDNLVVPASASPTISTPGLARTPDRHRAAHRRDPDLKPSTSPSFESSSITGARHYSQLVLSSEKN